MKTKILLPSKITTDIEELHTGLTIATSEE